MNYISLTTIKLSLLFWLSECYESRDLFQIKEYLHEFIKVKHSVLLGVVSGDHLSDALE